MAAESIELLGPLWFTLIIGISCLDPTVSDFLTDPEFTDQESQALGQAQTLSIPPG